MSAVLAEKPEAPAGAWRDQRRWLWWSALIVPLLPFVAFALSRWVHSDWIWWIGPVVLYGVIPVLDHLIGTDRANPPESAVAALAHDPYYHRLIRLFRYCPHRPPRTWPAQRPATNSDTFSSMFPSFVQIFFCTFVLCLAVWRHSVRVRRA